MFIKSSLRALTLVVLFAVFVSAQTKADLERGKQIYEARCSVCHGFDGAGGQGPSLNRPVLARAQDDAALVDILRNGVPAGGMPGVLRYALDNEVRQVAGYVRSLGRAVEVSTPGDVKQGAAIYQKLGCSSCHAINGDGGGFGPELTRIGTHRPPSYLRQAVTKPEAVLPRGVMAFPGRNLIEFLPVRVVTRDGREVLGIRVNEDSFTIQLKDSGSQFHTFRKSELKQLEKQSTKTLMPSYEQRLSAGELDHLVAYLYSLKGVK